MSHLDLSDLRRDRDLTVYPLRRGREHLVQGSIITECDCALVRSEDMSAHMLCALGAFLGLDHVIIGHFRHHYLLYRTGRLNSTPASITPAALQLFIHERKVIHLSYRVRLVPTTPHTARLQEVLNWTGQPGNPIGKIIDWRMDRKGKDAALWNKTTSLAESPPYPPVKSKAEFFPLSETPKGRRKAFVSTPTGGMSKWKR